MEESDRDAIELFLESLNAELDSDNIAEPLDLDPAPMVVRDLAEEGNTKSSSAKKQGIQLKHWFFTWNNYPPESIETLLVVFKRICKRFVFQREVGECGTPHLQGTISLIRKMRWTEFKLPPCIHWEKTHNIRDAYAYCSKENTRIGDQVWRWPTVNSLNIIKELRPWQQQVAMMVTGVPDDRTVNWIVDPHGGNGKTVFCKYMHATYDSIICTGGGAKDIACLLAILRDNGRDLNAQTTFMFNLSRTTEGISYKGIESVKDGLMTSAKYESSTLVFNCPHVWVLSNQEPNRNKLSADRWKLWTIVNNFLVEYHGLGMLEAFAGPRVDVDTGLDI